MDKDFVMQTAKTAEQQILWSIDKWAYLSWGISQKAAIEYEGMATLALRVSGLRHKGWVFISLNEGKDCYEVRLLNVARTKVKTLLDEVYCDNLGEVVDGLVEKDPKLTDDQYRKKAMKDSARKMGMEVIETNNNSINKNSEDKTMRLNMNANNETKNVAMEPQVNNNPIEDAVAVEITDVDVAEVEDITPHVTPKPKAEEKPVTIPLGDHGTLVVGKPGLKPKKQEPEPEVHDSVPQDGYRVVLVPAKDGSGEWPKLYGFQTEEEAEKIAGKMAKSIRNTWDRDEKNEKRFYIKGGKKYCEVFQRLCDALNAGNKAAIDAVCKDSVAVYEGAVADGKQKREERKAAREANTDSTDKTDKPAAPAMDAKEKELFELFKKFMAGDKSAMEQVGTMMTKKAA